MITHISIDTTSIEDDVIPSESRSLSDPSLSETDFEKRSGSGLDYH